ncbi:uncharacterized protein LOC130668699 isoform X1 [Microplitis mediator]|uniref:uncharacterized protein LOC130668699 isoform X1 n=1 Tax=Microplitis mediator TaxID=375433 RepID=UPI002552924C|nr:uncharacterized protein LOC130668699 isoform X1 [Microplitis mediator]
MEDYVETGSDDEVSNNGSPVQINDTRREIIDSNTTQSNLPQNPTRTRSRSPVVPIRERSWKSVNAFINYLHDYRKTQHEFPGKLTSANLFKLAGDQWRQMTQEQKQPYIDGANKIRKLKNLERQKNKDKQQEKPAPQLKTKRARNATKIKNYREFDDSREKKKRRKNKDIHYKNVIIKNISDSSSDSDNYGRKSSDTSI